MEKIVSFLKKGGIVIHNTDTCLGMAADISNEAAVELLYKVKRMERGKPVSILCADLEMAREYGVFSDKALELARKYLPGALTLIVPRTEKLPKFLNPGLDNIGIRIPDDEFSLEMVCELGNPVTTTSCNVSGNQVCLTDSQVNGVFADEIYRGEMLVAFEGEGTTKVSTIVKVEGDGIRIIRAGAVSINEVG